LHHAENRYLVVEVGDDFPVEVPRGTPRTWCGTATT
jgi:hypothetical protein